MIRLSTMYCCLYSGCGHVGATHVGLPAYMESKATQTLDLTCLIDTHRMELIATEPERTRYRQSASRDTRRYQNACSTLCALCPCWSLMFQLCTAFLHDRRPQMSVYMCVCCRVREVLSRVPCGVGVEGFPIDEIMAATTLDRAQVSVL